MSKVKVKENYQRAGIMNAILSEREYQDRLWGDVEQSQLETLAMIQNYVNKGINWATTQKNPDAEIRNIMRKIGALAFASMEQHGVEQRSMRDLQYAEEYHGVELEEEEWI